MPIEQFQHSWHLRRKINQQVFDNIARLEHIARHSHSQEQLLTALHPWNAPVQLRFNNQWPLFIALCGLGCWLPLWLWSHWLSYLLAVIGLCALFYAYLSYEISEPIKNTIQALEQSSIQHQYQLAFQQQPRYINTPLNPVLFVAQLRQLYPVFSRGNLRNDLPFYASGIWQDHLGIDHQILCFEYCYTHEVVIRDQHGEKLKIKEQEERLWGVFVLNIDLPLKGLAFTTLNSRFGAPYIYPWHSSDIQTNQIVKIYTDDELSAAKRLTPAHVLHISEFLLQQPGDLLFHPEHQSLCFLTKRNLFELQSKAKQIHTISELRGHLRTLKLPHLERLQAHMLHLLKHYH